MERSEAAEEEEEAGGSSSTLAPQQHSTIWKQIQARAKPLLSPKLGLRDPEKSRWTFRKTKRREETLVVLDRVISSSQPDLLYSSPGEEAAAVGATQATQLCGKTVPGGPGKSPGKSPGKLPGKPTVAHLVMSHHKSSSLGSAGLERLAEPRGGEQRAVEAPAAGKQPDQQPVTAVSGVSGSSGVQGDQVSVDQVSGVQVDQVSVDQVSVDQVHPPSGMYKLEVEVKRGINLAVRDRGGSSDPYVKLKVGGREVFRTRTIHKNLNPVWNETTSLLLEGLREPVYVKVFDYDFGLHDDFMGSAFIHLESLEQNRTVPVSLVLKDPQYPDQDLGSLELNVTLSPKDSPLEERRDSTQSSLRLSDRKSQVSGGVVGVALIEGRGLTPMDANGLSDPYVRFRLGQQKYRSKTMPKTLNPQWREQFELHLYEDSCGVLELTVWDRDTGRRDDFMGRTQVDLTQLPRERTHHLELALEEARGLLVLLVTLTGSAHLSRDDLSITPLDDPQERTEILQRYGAFKSFRNLRDVGIVQVKVLRAGGLMVADVTGKSDPFCVLELNNERLQTHTVYKNLNPEWNKVFTFNVTDVHSVLEVTVFDEDRDRSADFLGKVAIPLLYVRNGEQKSYVLKNKELTEPTKGTIDLELHLVYNTVKAALRTIVPAEQKYIEEEPKVSKQLLQQNFNRVKRCIMVLIGYGTFINSCFEWESPQRSIISFMVFVVVVWNVELFMVPLALLLLLLWNFFFSCGGGSDDADLRFEWEDEDEDREDRDSESRGFMEKLYAIQDVFLSVQTALDGVASYAERIKNTANWTVPFLSCLAVTALCSATVLLYLVPLRFLVLVWGVNKFTKKLRNPYLIDNNELLDFLSRVPSDVQVMHYRELKVDPCQSPTKRR